MKRVWYRLQFEAVAPGSLCAAGTLAVPYLLYRLFTCSSSSSPFSAGTFQRQCSISACWPAPPCLSAVVLSPHGLLWSPSLSSCPCCKGCLPFSAWFPLHGFPHAVDSYFPSLSHVESPKCLLCSLLRSWFLCFIYSALGLHQLLPQNKPKTRLGGHRSVSES